MPKNISKDVAAETISTDSLSFASFICTEEQSSKSQKVHASPTNNNATITQEDHDFEFNSVVAPPTAVASGKNINTIADLFSSGDQLVPQQAIQMETSKSENSNIKSLSANNKIAGAGAKKRINNTNKQQTNAGQWFGQRIIQSIATPCRDCRAIEPSHSVKEQSLRQ